MAYNLTLTNGSALLTLNDGTEDSTTTSINLVGENYTGYGLLINENFIKILENFSSASAPNNPLLGQLWWDSTNKHLSVWQGTNWKIISSSQTGATPPLNPVVGDFWWNTVNSQFSVYSGTSWISIGPAILPGAAITAITGNTVTDITSTPHTVGNVLVNNKLVAVASSDSTAFVPQTSISGLSTINPGMNFASSVESTMITSANSAIGVSSGNLQISSTASNNGLNLSVNVGGTQTNVLAFSGTTGLGVVNGTPTAPLGIATKGYVDTQISAITGGGSGNTIFASNLLPAATLNYTIGNVSRQWLTGYFGTVSAGNVYAATIGNSGATITGTIATASQTNITAIGTIATGTWQGNIVNPTYGGTGVNNGSNTLTLSGGSYTLNQSVVNGAAPTFVGTNFSGTAASLTAGAVTNGVYTSGSYANPVWITSLAYGKLTGAPTSLNAFSNDPGYQTASGSVSHATTASSTPALSTTNFAVFQSGSKLYFQYNGTNIASLDSSGNFIALNNITAFASP